MSRFSMRKNYPTKNVYGQVIKITHGRNLMIKTEYGSDVFCHSTDAEADTVGIRQLNYGDIVEFDIEKYGDIYCAKNVKLVKAVNRSEHVVIGKEHVKLAWIKDFGFVSGKRALAEHGISTDDTREHGYEPDDFEYIFINYCGGDKVTIFEENSRTSHLNLGDTRVDNVESEYKKLNRIFTKLSEDYMLCA